MAMKDDVSLMHLHSAILDAFAIVVFKSERNVTALLDKMIPASLQMIEKCSAGLRPNLMMVWPIPVM